MLVITGASDDLIQINGDFQDSFDAYDCRNGRLALSDGTLLRVVYDENGIWRFTPIVKGSLFDRKEDGSVDDDTNDVVYFKDGVRWVLFSDDAQEATVF